MKRNRGIRRRASVVEHAVNTLPAARTATVSKVALPVRSNCRKRSHERARPQWGRAFGNTGPCLTESRTGHAAVGIGRVSPPSLKQRERADRMTPAQPAKAVGSSSQSADAMPGSADTAAPFAPHRAKCASLTLTTDTRIESRADMKKIDDATMKAIGAYAGPVTRCATGKACGPDPIRRPSATARWLQEHRGDQRIVDPKGSRRRRRMERARRERIAARNAALMRQR